MIAAAEEAMPAQRQAVILAVEEDYRDLDAPRDTGRLLSSLRATPAGPNEVKFFVAGSNSTDPASQAVYGAWLNTGTGIYGPTGQPITSTRPGGSMSWIDQLSQVRVFRKVVAGIGQHVGWWDRWRDLSVPGAVRRGWHSKVR